jgi:HEAT repeat protein
LPDGPGFYRANLVELTCGVDHRCRAALPRLTKAEPKELREEIAGAIENLLIADDKETRRRAVEALSVWSTSDLVPLLIDLLEDESGDVRAAAIEALAEREDPRAHGPVAQCLGRSTEEGRAAAEYLKRMGAKAEQALLPCLEHEDIRARLKALELLAEFGTPETKLAAAIAALDDSESIVRSRACSILEELKDARAVEPLVELFFDHSVHASDCLIAHGPAAEEAVLKLLSDWRRDVVRGAVKILEKIGTEKSIPALMVLSQSNDISLRGAVNAAGKAIVAREGIEIPPDGVPR